MTTIMVIIMECIVYILVHGRFSEGTSERRQRLLKRLRTEATWEGYTSCDDCQELSRDLVSKSDHHGGTKTVCKDRDACHKRSPG